MVPETVGGGGVDLVDELEELMLLVRYHMHVQPEYLLTVCHATGYHLVKKDYKNRRRITIIIAKLPV
jgi:hypothetical protein